MRKALWLTVFAVLLQSSAFADAGSSEMMDMLKKMQKQMNEMQSTIQAQNEKIHQLEAARMSEAPQPSAETQSSTGSATMSDADFQKSLKDNVGESIPWMKGLKFGGDLRLRMENFMYTEKNNDAGSTGTIADRERNRYRIRLRFGFEKDYGDDWKVGFRLATGSATDPTSTNVTLGNPGYFNFKTVLIDRAFAVYEPNGLKDYGILKGAKIGAGKFENPFLRYSTPILWDPDVTPEGLYEQANWQFFSDENNRLNVQTTLGQFIMHENTAIYQDAQIWAMQAATTFSTYGFGTEQPVDFSTAVSFYDYQNWQDTVLATNNVTTSYLRTNSIFADRFRVLDIYPEVTFAVKNTPVTLWYDYVVNTANEGTNLAAAGGNDIHDSDTAWGLGFKLGKAKKKGTWETFYGYYEIGVNAVPAAFNDSDFGGPGQNGGTNRKGHKFGASYMLTDAVSVNWTGFLVQPLHPTAAAAATVGLANATNEDVFRSQLDLVYKF